ncbi:MAG: hypothetical protein HRT47_02190 [Candidatus Caenarcaniphilales bacterium]|nr:hypothetical protein [Candidatus Caenarcaniphilales bacterium]
MQMIAREDISSKSNKLGDKLLMQLASPVFSGDDLALPVGMVFEAEITDLKKAGEHGEEAYLNITLKNLITHSGTRVPMRARLNHEKLSLVTKKNSVYSKITPDSKGKPFLIKRGVTIPFLVSQTFRFEHDYELHRMIKSDQANIKAGLSSKNEDEKFIPFFDPTQTRHRRNAFEDPAKIFSREKNKNPYF